MSRQNLAQKAQHFAQIRRTPKSQHRKPPPYVNLPRVFTPLKPVHVHKNAFKSQPRSALEFAQASVVPPYFPRDTVFVLHGPKGTGEKERNTTATYSAREAPMTSHVDIITTPTADTAGACLYVHFDKRRYLFGRLSEGVQRAFGQRKMAPSSLEQVFVSGEVNWSSVGGMMGLLLTVADVTAGARDSLAELNQERETKGRKAIVKDFVERLDIHGAENLTYSLATARNFIFRNGMPFVTHELTEDRRVADPKVSGPDWEDDCLRVWKLPLCKQASSPSKKRRREGEEDGDEMEVDSPTHKRRKSEDRRTLSNLVESMFNSDWRMDALVPTKLLDVQLPATIFVRGEDHSIHKYKGPLPEKGKDVPNIDVLVREPWPATKVHTLPQTHYSAQSMCYIAKTHPRRGKFKASVAKELGVPPRENKKLAAGESVQGKDGITVTPEMVLEPTLKGTGFMVVDIVNASYVGSFLARPEWANEELMDGVAVVYWVLGKDVVSHPDIRGFMKDRPQLKHIVLSPDTCPNMVAFESHAGLVERLRRIDPERFPSLKFNNLVPDLKTPDAPFMAGRAGKRVKLMPQLQLEDQNIVPFFNPDDHAKAMDNKVMKLAAAARAKASDPKFLAWIKEDEKDIPNRDTEITPLGTGSAIPSKYRNVSSTLIRVPGIGSYLLDCGENTLGQLRRAYGYEETKKILAELRCVFISHMHADHHLGTMSVIDAWQKAAPSTSTLAISCTNYMRRFIEEYSQVQPVDFSRVKFYGDSHSDTNYEYTFPDGDATGLRCLERVRVEHCKSAHAGILTWSSGLKIAYSGDCRPSFAFAKKAKGASLLVHEATFEDDKGGDAMAKKHSTMAEALSVADKMEARRVLLTHFSQRYAKIVAEEKAEVEEVQGKEPEPGSRVVLNAFDQMRVRLGDFRKAEVFLPAIRRLLEEES